MIQSEPIKETISKKGRPRCAAANIMDKIPPHLIPAGTHRTRVDRVYFLHAASQLQGFLADHDFMSKGASGALVEIGRYLMAGHVQPDTFLFIQSARADGTSWTRIKRHFRQLRLGERHPKTSTLASAITRTIEEYRKQFPLTDRLDIGNALALAGLPYADMEQ